MYICRGTSGFQVPGPSEVPADTEVHHFIHSCIHGCRGDHGKAPQTAGSPSYLVHLGALPLAVGAGDLDGDGAVVALPSQVEAVGLQRAEGDLQLWTGEAAGPALLRGDLRRLQDRREPGRALRDRERRDGVRGHSSVTGTELRRHDDHH